MKKILLFASFLTLFALQVDAQTSKIWTEVQKSADIEVARTAQRSNFPEDFKLFTVDLGALRQSLSAINDNSDGNNPTKTIISLPNSNGQIERFRVFESSNFTPELQALYPQIRAYAGNGIDDANAQIRFSISPSGIQTMVFRTDKTNEFMEPYSTDGKVCAVFNSSRKKGELPFTCGTDDVELFQTQQRNYGLSENRSNDQVYRTFRLALSCTGEYSNYYGATSAAQVNLVLTAFNNTMTRVNGVYDKDFAVKFTIIASTTSVIYYDGTTDPYSDAATGVGSPGNPPTWNGQLQATLTSVITEGNYDIGHLFGASGGGGNAGCIGCICVNNAKGSAFTSPSNNAPVGDTFDIDYVAHEIGHQVGGRHTFSHATENNNVNVEPGSGSTIMAYAGITTGPGDTPNTDVQPNSDDYFVYASILQVQNNLATKTCGTSRVLTNTPPVINAGLDWTIPRGTPFILTGTGSDAEPLNYCWEENDDANITTTVVQVARNNSMPAGTKTNGPNFRSRKPLTVPVRYMPLLSSVLSNTTSTTWETLSTVNRTLNFVLTGRDNLLDNAQTNSDAMIVTVGNTGPFDVTSQDVAGINWVAGTTETITWTVNNTLNLVGSANVNILLSTDGGLTFPTTLASNVPNNGSANITVPNTPSQNCRVMVRPTGNIFYDINPIRFTIGFVCNNASAAPGSAIDDGLGANQPGPTTTEIINFANSIVINNMKVSVETDHTWIGDLTLRIKHPDNTQITLWSRCCNNPRRTGLNATFQDGAPQPVCASPVTGAMQSGTATATTFTPTLLSVFNGKPSAGNWTLTAFDNYNGDTGNIVAWGIDFGCTLNNETFSVNDYALYPNPNKGSFNLRFQSTSNEVVVSVFDIRGRSVFNKTYSTSGLFDNTLNLGEVNSGVYLVNIKDGDRIVVKKIVVE